MSKEKDIAQTIFNLLGIKKEFNNDDFEFVIDYDNKKVNKLIFINERINNIFCDITGKELFKYFNN
jgi:hypothetical protein